MSIGMSALLTATMVGAASPSQATASKALRGVGNVGPSLVAAVKQAAMDLGYRPDLSARALRSGRLGIVAVAIPQMPEGSEFRNAPGFWERSIHTLLHEFLRADFCTIVTPRIGAEQLMKVPCDALVVLTNDPNDLAMPLGHHPNTPLLVIGLEPMTPCCHSSCLPRQQHAGATKMASVQSWQRQMTSSKPPSNSSSKGATPSSFSETTRNPTFNPS